MKASKEKEIEFADESIESKKERSGTLAVEIVQDKDGAEDATAEAEKAEKFAATLTTQCAAKKKEWAERSKMRSEEIAAISEAIGILNDDDALDVFKKTAASALVQAPVGLLQRSTHKASRAQRAQSMLAHVAAKYKTPTLKLLLYTINSKLKHKSHGGFGEVIKMIDDMVVLLGKQQDEE